MKKITITTTLFVLSAITVIGQIEEPPAPPAPPIPPVTSTTSTSTSSTTTHNSESSQMENSYSYSTNENGVRKSIHINNSDNTYQLKAAYNSAETYEDLKALLLNEMNDANLKNEKTNYNWKVRSNNKFIYRVELKAKSLEIHIDKKLASPALAQKIQDLEPIIKSIIRGNKNNDLEQLQRDAMRLTEDAKRMQNEALRLLEVNSSDAQQLKAEAIKLKGMAEKIELEARHQGGVNPIIESLLRQSSTLYVRNEKNWNWPAFQDQLIQQLIEDQLIKNESKITFTYDNDGIFVNGSKMSSSQSNNYFKLCSENNISKSNKFSFYKNKNHIVITNHNAKIENFFKDLSASKIISNQGSTTKLNIDGSLIKINGKILSPDQTAKCNKLLEQNNIISAPGKIIEQINSKIYQLGYQTKNKTLLGTFIDNNQ